MRDVWLTSLIIRDFIEKKLWEKHRVKRHEVEEALTHRQAIRLRHRKGPIRTKVIGAAHSGRLLKIILEFQGRGRYFLVPAMEINAKEKRRYGKKIKGHS